MQGIESNIIEELARKLQEQRDEFIKLKLREKGFPQYAEVKERARFPKVAIAAAGGWSYIFADNGTREGAFIVAIQDYDFSPPVCGADNYRHTISAQFTWQDNDCSAVSLDLFPEFTTP